MLYLQKPQDLPRSWGFFLQIYGAIMQNNRFLNIDSELKNRIDKFSVPEALGFGNVLAPLMAQAKWSEGVWSEPELVPFEPLMLSPATKALHYGQQIFEGMKAYNNGKGPLLFRMEAYGRRFQASAERMAMPGFPLDFFQKSLVSLVYHLQAKIPQGEGASLYLRPYMMATGEGLGLDPSKSFLFLAMASPSSSYFSNGSNRALIERTDCRAAPGGTGTAKTAGNYAGSFRSSYKAELLGCKATLWLDAIQKTYVEEFSGMNFFAYVDGKLLTPQLNSSILSGITRDSIIQLARRKGIEVQECLIDINKLIEDIKQKKCREIFSCGTAAVISSIEELAEKDGTLYQLPKAETGSSPLWKELRRDLVDLQLGKTEDPFAWVTHVNSWARPSRQGDL